MGLVASRVSAGQYDAGGAAPAPPADAWSVGGFSGTVPFSFQWPFAEAWLIPISAA